MDSAQIKRIFLDALTPILGMEEAQGMFKHYKLHLLAQKDISSEQLKEDIHQLSLKRPIQYVLGKTFFYSSEFRVNESVLIPRPETEELVRMILEKNQKESELSIIDIGTGSGCILLSLLKELPKARGIGIDISESALKLAQQNAKDLGIIADFKCLDIREEHLWTELESFDVIVSNPPYIDPLESDRMGESTLAYEPDVALFSPGDPELFYKKIAKIGKTHLSKKGEIWCEMNEYRATQIQEVFRSRGYETETFQDMQGKDRVILAKL